MLMSTFALIWKSKFKSCIEIVSKSNNRSLQINHLKNVRDAQSNPSSSSVGYPPQQFARSIHERGENSRRSRSGSPMDTDMVPVEGKKSYANVSRESILNKKMIRPLPPAEIVSYTSGKGSADQLLGFSDGTSKNDFRLFLLQK